MALVRGQVVFLAAVFNFVGLTFEVLALHLWGVNVARTAVDESGNVK